MAILEFVLLSLAMWPGRCRDTRDDSGDDRILGSCLVCKGDCPWRVTYHPCGTSAMMHHRTQIMMHREFMQLYASNFDELKTLSMFARFTGPRRSFRHRAKLEPGGQAGSHMSLGTVPVRTLGSCWCTQWLAS
jgi:hypothetical protein